MALNLSSKRRTPMPPASWPGARQSWNPAPQRYDSPRPNPLAIASLVTAVLGIWPLPQLLGLGEIYGYLVLWSVAVGLGSVAIPQIRHSHGEECGYSMAITRSRRGLGGPLELPLVHHRLHVGMTLKARSACSPAIIAGHHAHPPADGPRPQPVPPLPGSTRARSARGRWPPLSGRGPSP